jgi:hypothetical protein
LKSKGQSHLERKNIKEVICIKLLWFYFLQNQLLNEYGLETSN